MKIASITQTKNQLSALLDEVKRGGSVLIMDRGRPVARLVAVERLDDAETVNGLIERLERVGIVRRAEEPADASLLDGPPPKQTGDASALQALIAERKEGP
jgi:prevent-host-death family protein